MPGRRVAGRRERRGGRIGRRRVDGGDVVRGERGVAREHVVVRRGALEQRPRGGGDDRAHLVAFAAGGLGPQCLKRRPSELGYPAGAETRARA